MFTNSLDNKPIITRNDGTKMVDLTKSMFDFNDSTYVPLFMYKVPKDYNMRPDLISQEAYGTTEHAELILKYNGYSNPYSIQENDVIVIPNLTEVKNKIKDTKAIDGEAEKIRNAYKYIDPTKVPVKDDKLKKFEERSLEGLLPPNIAQEGEQQITIRSGRVYFGENISKSACLQNGMASSEFLSQTIKSNA